MWDCDWEIRYHQAIVDLLYHHQFVFKIKIITIDDTMETHLQLLIMFYYIHKDPHTG